MRLDKFLKTARIIKRRILAKEACEQGRVSIDGRPAKADSTVQVGSIIKLQTGSKILEMEVLEVPEKGLSRQSPEFVRYLKR